MNSPTHPSEPARRPAPAGRRDFQDSSTAVARVAASSPGEGPGAGLVGVIPAAGRGTRAYPYTRGTPKSMLEVDGDPNLKRTLVLMRDDLGIREVVIILGNYGEVIVEHFGDGADLGLTLHYVRNDAIDKGLSHSILLSRPYVRDRHFCVILADECYLGSNHRDLLGSGYEHFLATCGVALARQPEQTRKNYAVEVVDGLIKNLIEKPTRPGEGHLGLGTWIFSPRMYHHLERALASPADGPSDPVSVLGRLARGGELVAPFYVSGHYVNINDRDELNLANSLSRSHRFAERSLSLTVIERGPVDDTLRVAEEFRSLGCFAQVVVVLAPGSELHAGVAGIELVHARSADYGDLLRAGFDALRGDILFSVYGDGAFSPRDVPKFLEYLKEADLVVGSRTTRQLIHQGTNMRGIVRLAHVCLAKFLEVVWWKFEPRFTDVGCTYRAIWRSAYRHIRPRLVSAGPAAAVEMALEILKCRKRVIEIPVHFQLPRPGVKARDQRPRTVIDILGMIVRRRLAGPRGFHAFGSRPGLAALRRGSRLVSGVATTVDIVVPVYNEAESLDELHVRLTRLGLGASLVFVDNASTDDSVAHIQRFHGARLIRHASNRGYGSSIRDGLAASRAPAVVIIDADLEYPPEAIPSMLAALERHPVVYGSRFLGPTPPAMPALRRFGNRVISAVFNTLFGQRTTDFYTGTKAMRGEVRDRLALTQDGFEHVVELGAQICRLGYDIHEVPVDYKLRAHGASKMRHIPELAKYVWHVGRYWFGYRVLRRPVRESGR